MNKKKLTTLFLGGILCLCCNLVRSQNEATNSDVKPDPKIEKKIRFEISRGDEYFNVYQYNLALEFYQKAYNLNNKSALANYKIGLCKSYSDEFEESIKYLTTAFSLDSSICVEFNYCMGYNYFFTNKFNESKKYFKLCLNQKKVDKNKKEEAYIKLRQCDNAALLLKDTLPLKIINLGDSINSKHIELNPVISSDNKLYFRAIKPVSENSKKSFSDMTMTVNGYCSLIIDSAFRSPKKLPTSTFTREIEQIATFSKNKNKLYITCYNSEASNGLDFYSCEQENGHWKKLQDLGAPFNTIANELDISFTADGKTAFFTRDDGYSNGFDIYYTTKNDDATWSLPMKIGPVINSTFNEKHVSISNDGKTLYFTSDGLNSMGGYDIFKSVLNDDGNWSTPVNLGYPINTIYNEFDPFLIEETNIIYFSSDRIGGKGGPDLYKVKF